MAQRWFRSLVGLVLAGLAMVPLVLWAQPAPPAGASDPRFGGAVQVNEVLLDVLVTDHDGNVVIGLTPEDFIVEEDGRGQVELNSLAFYSHRQLLDSLSGLAPGLEPGQVPEDRFFLLFFYRPPAIDSTYFLRLTEAARDARRWVRGELSPGDHVAVVAYDGRLRLYRDFTVDRAVVERAIELAAAGKEPEGAWPSRAGSRSVPVLLDRLPQDDALRDASRNPYEALQTLAGALGGIIGRKNVILFGVDFPTFNARLNNYRDPLYFPPTVQALNDNNVAVYTIPLVGRSDQDMLLLLAEDTGGTYAGNFASYLDPLRRIAKENSGYYLLSYTASHPAGTAGYQQIRVRARNPEFVVRARQGYLYGNEE